MKIKNTGFTLVELMIAVAIIGVLAGIAYPSYVQHGYKVRRANAQAALVSLANAMEQWKMESALDQGYLGAAEGGGDVGTPGVYPSKVPTSGAADYELTISDADVNSYTITATPVGTQAIDGWISLDNLGNKTCDESVVWCNDLGGTW